MKIFYIVATILIIAAADTLAQGVILPPTRNNDLGQKDDSQNKSRRSSRPTNQYIIKANENKNDAVSADTISGSSMRKYGCIDIEKVVNVMPQYIEYKARLQSMEENAIRTQSALEKEYRTKSETIHKKKKPRKKDLDELQRFATNIESKKSQSEKEIKEYKESMQSKLNIILNELIEKASVGKVEIIFYVDLPLYIGSDVIDITELVMELAAAKQ